MCIENILCKLKNNFFFLKQCQHQLNISLKCAILLVIFFVSFFHLQIEQTVATTLSMMYVARTLDAFISIRALVIKSILSKYVNADELGRSFSIIAIIEAIGKFVFVSLYSVVYENTLETWPAAFYFVSFIFLVITAILFLYVNLKNSIPFHSI